MKEVESQRLIYLQKLEIQDLETQIKRYEDEVFLAWFQLLNLPRIFGGSLLLLILAAWLLK